MPRSSSVTIAAIVAFLGSLLVLVISFQLGTVGLRMVTQSTFVQPPLLRRAFLFAVLALAGHGVWGVATAVGLIRRKNWARVSLLVISGVLVFVGAGSILSLLLLPALMPDGAEQSAVREMTLGMLVFYGLLVIVGTWWLVLFTRRRIREEFQTPATSVAPLPKSITFVAWYMVSTGMLIPFLALLDWPAGILGVILTGWAARFFNIGYGLVWVAAGYFLLKRKTWSLLLSEGFFGFVILNALIFSLLPGKQSEFIEAFFRAWSLTERAADVPSSPVWLQLLMVSLFAGLPLWLLWSGGKKYLEACPAPGEPSGFTSRQI